MSDDKTAGEKRSSGDADGAAPTQEKRPKAADAGDQEAAPKVYRGACFCGQTTIEATGPVLFRCLCHCVICQKFIGAPATAFVGFAGQQLRVTKGEEQLTAHASSDNMTRFRCGGCGAPVIAKSTNPAYDFSDSPLTMFERDEETGQIRDLDDLRPDKHIFAARRVHGLVKADPDGVIKFVGHYGQSDTTDECP